MIEPYQWLYEHAEELGYRYCHIGAASVDLELGEVTALKGSLDTWMPPPYVFDPEEWTLHPGGFYLCSTVEYIKVPDTHAAMIQMRSSPARKGLGHKMAGFVDPGFEGQLTLELEASLPITLQRGERVVQLIYIKLTEPTGRPYVGKYQGQRGPTGAYHAV